MLPKQTQLQKSTLSIQTPVTMFSCERGLGAEDVSKGADSLSELVTVIIIDEGAGIISGLTPSSRRVPAKENEAESTNPARERSISHQRRGLTRASVPEACSVDAQGSFRCVVMVSGNNKKYSFLRDLQ